MRVMIAEDDAFILGVYKAKLSKITGYEVEIATDGEDVIQKIDKFKPDVLLLDIMMPKKDGLAVLRDLRADPKWKNLPIIVASNLGQKEDVESAKKFGANEFLIKSDMAIDDVIEMIRKYSK